MKIISIFITIAAAILSILAGCTGNSVKVSDRLDRAEALMAEIPDSAIAIIQSFYPYSQLSEKDKARVGILLCSSKLMQGATLAYDDILDTSINYYRTTDDSVNLVKAYQLKSFQTEQRGQNDSAALYIQKALSIVGEEPSDIEYALCLRLSNLYSSPLAVKDYPKAISIAKTALKYTGDSLKMARVFNDISACYDFSNQSDSSTVYAKMAVDYACSDRRSSDYTQYVLNYANTPGLDFGIARSLLISLPDTASLGRLITLGTLCLNNDHVDEALRYAREANAKFANCPQRYSVNTFNNLNILNACLDVKKGQDILASYGVLRNDSINERMALSEALKKEMTEENMLLQKHVYEVKVHQQRLWFMVILGCAVVVMLFFLYDRRRKQNYIRLRKELDQIRVTQLEQEYSATSASKSELLEKTFGICRERFLLTGWLQKLNEMEGAQKTGEEKYLPMATRAKLRSAVFENFADFIIDLKEDSPEVNIDDILFAILTKLNVSRPVISGCMGVSDSAVRTRKSRLATKLSVCARQFVFGQ